MDFILPPVGFRPRDPNFYIFGALKTRGSMMSTLSIDVFIISIKVCLIFILSVRKRTCVGEQQFP